MPSEVRGSRGQDGDSRTLVTLWNTTATGVFLAPAGAQIKVRYGDAWPICRDSQRRTLDRATEKRLIVGRWSAAGVVLLAGEVLRNALSGVALAESYSLLRVARQRPARAAAAADAIDRVRTQATP